MAAPRMNASAMTREAAVPYAGVLVLSGYGIRVAMERGHLVVEDGVGGARRFGRFPRVDPGFDRLVVIGHTGAVTFDALRWLQDVGVAFVQIDTDSRVIATGSSSRVRDVRVRRGQAQAAVNGIGLAVARELLAGKVEGQAIVAARFDTAISDALRAAIQDIETAASVDRARYIESRAAVAYWNCWRSIPVRFIEKDQRRVPAHWRMFGDRRSPLSGSGRKAANPGNAMLNYLYAVLESEVRIALTAVGCDSGMGLVHSDKTYDDAFVFDVMEPVRPHVDAYLLDLLATRPFSRLDFFETRDGWCKLMPSIARPLAGTASQWGKLLAPIAEHVADRFARARPVAATNASAASGEMAPVARPIRTPLTGRNRSRSHSGSRPIARPAEPTSAWPARCKQCGGPARKSRTYCDNCLDSAKRANIKKAARLAQTRRLAGVTDRRRLPEAQEKKRARLAVLNAERRAWEATHDTRPNRAVFLREIAPKLAAIPAEFLAQKTGRPLASCKDIQEGKWTPHARHWDAFRAAIAEFERNPVPKEPWETLAPDTFAARIEPHLERLRAEDMQRATGLSFSYCRRMRFGHHVPHRRHWPALIALIEKRAGRD